MGISIWFRATAFVIAAAACGHPPSAAGPGSPPSAAPAELAIPALTEHRTEPQFHADRIYVYGRAENRIAFITEPADEACDCYRPSIVIQDLRTGTLVWSDSYDSESAPPAERYQTVDELWRARGADWERRLREAGIEREPAPALTMVPTGGTTVPRFELRTEQSGDTVTAYRLDLVTSQSTKEIASASGATDLRSIEVVGVVPPVGDGAAAVLLLETRAGFENSALHNVRVVGADLRVAPN